MALRFDPPRMVMPPSLWWALVRAFAPPSSGGPRPVSGREALDLARRFDLSSRIGGRHPLAALADEVGAQVASAFALEHGMNRRAAAGLGGLVVEVAENAARLGIPVVLLKFAALRAIGCMPDGLRVAGDVDVLVPEAQAASFAASLAQRGLRPTGFRPGRHQLRQQRDDLGRQLEVHVHVPGVRLPREEHPVTATGLLEAGLAQRLDLPGECYAPARELLTAHAIVHVIAQHGFGPRAYPAFRMVGDLIALDVAGEATPGGSAVSYVSDELTSDEWLGAVSLSARLSRGDTSLLASEAADSPESILLRHFVAGRLDADYARSLRWREFQRGAGGPLGAVRATIRASQVSDAEIDAIYGRPRSRLGYLGRRLARPFDLAWRAVRYTAASLRIRRRQ